MRTVTLPLPTFGFIVATRAALAAGLGMLVANRLSTRDRRIVGLVLAGIGAVTTIPAAYWLSQSMHRQSENGSQSDPALIDATPLGGRATMPHHLGNVPRESWRSELDRFSRQHEGWLVSVVTRTPDGTRAVEAHDVPLEGVSIASHTPTDVAVSLGNTQNHLTHDVHDVVAVRVELTGDGIERALLLEAADGSATAIEIRSPIRPEEVDGLPATDRA